MDLILRCGKSELVLTVQQFISSYTGTLNAPISTSLGVTNSLFSVSEANCLIVSLSMTKSKLKAVSLDVSQLRPTNRRPALPLHQTDQTEARGAATGGKKNKFPGSERERREARPLAHMLRDDPGRTKPKGRPPHA